MPSRRLGNFTSADTALGRPRTICAIGTAANRRAAIRAPKICTTVLGKMLAYADDQPIKPETWRKLRAGIDFLKHKGALVATI